MAISARSAGTWAIATADPVTFVIPAGATTGDLMLLQVSWKDYSVTADVSGWTELLEWADGTTGAGNGSGSMKVGLWYKEHSGSESNPSWNPSGTANIGAGVITVFQKGAGEQWVAPAYATASLSWGTGGGTATAGNTLDISDGDIVVALVGIRDDSSGIGRGTATGIGGAGVTWNGNYTEYPATHYSTTTNLDMSADAGYRAVTTGSAGVSLTAQGTLDATETGSVMFVRLRALKPTGTGTVTLPALTILGVANQTLAADGSIATPSATVSGTATETNAASGDLALGTVTLSGVASETFDAATGTPTLPGLDIVGSGAQDMTSSGALVLAASVIDGVGFVPIPLEATADIVLAPLQVTGVGVQSLTAMGAIAGQPISVVGAASETMAATGALSLSTATITDGVGEQRFTSSGSLTLEAATLAGTASETMAATGALSLGTSTVDGIGSSIETALASGNVVLVAPTMDGTGLVSFTAAGDIALPGLAIDGVGEVIQSITATGALSVGGLVIDGVADNGEVVTPTPGGYYRRRPLPKPKPMPIVGTGDLVVAAATVRGTARSELDDLWLYLEPALYLAGVT